MVYGGLGAVQEILSFRVLIESVLKTLGRHETPSLDEVKRLLGRLEAIPSTNRFVKDGVASGSAASNSKNPSAFQEFVKPDPAAVMLLKKVASQKLRENENEKLVEFLTKVDRDLMRQRTTLPAGRYL